jgi:pyruvate ferredoxin oxidoreductase delta subunit
MGQLFAIEIIYRGVFQKTLAKNICRGIVLAAHNEGKPGISFGRYSDSPERNGIPAKAFAIVATDDQTLEEGMAQYEPKQTDVTVVLDDSLCKGLESWGWYGVHTVTEHLKPNATLIVTSLEKPETLLKAIHVTDRPYKLGMVRGVTSYSGMWVYKDDHTDVRILGAIAKALPALMKQTSVEKYVNDTLKNSLKVTSAHTSFEKFSTIEVKTGQGSQEKLAHFTPLKYSEMRTGVTVKGQGQGAPYADPVTKEVGGFRPARNPDLKKATTRSMRPVVNFETCTKCTLCWLNCPDGSFDVTPDGTYDANLDACCGCGICESVCPVPNCIRMVAETSFSDSNSQWTAFRKDKAAYKAWLNKIVVPPAAERSHGFRFKGQYKDQAVKALEIAQQG